MNRLATLVLVPTDSPGSVTPPLAQSISEKEALIAQKTAKGARAWQITFTPSAALVARGMDVNAVRQRLQALGEIAHSAPLIAPGGRIEFLFILISLATEQEVTAIQGDGLACEPYGSRPDSTAKDAQTPTLADVEGEGHSTHLTPANVVRVDLERLDELMRLVGELVLSRARLEDGLHRLDAVAPPAEVRSVRETSAAIERQLRDLREWVMRVRMLSATQAGALARLLLNASPPNDPPLSPRNSSRSSATAIGIWRD